MSGTVTPWSIVPTAAKDLSPTIVSNGPGPNGGLKPEKTSSTKAAVPAADPSWQSPQRP
jgi:hypothetical protein